MKTAVSIPDNLFDAAELLAKRLGVSRSELYARAIAAYTKQQTAAPPHWDQLDDAELTQHINAALAESGTEATKLDAAWKTARNRSLGKEDW